MNSIFVRYFTSTAFQEGGPCTFMTIQVQNFQSLLQTKTNLHFALRNSLFSAPRKVDKNTPRMVTNRYYSLTIDAKKVASRRRFEH